MAKMNDGQRYLIEEFVEEYHERHMSRRDLLRRAVLIMGGAAAAATAIRHAERALASAEVHTARVGSWPGSLSAQGQADRGAGTMPPPAQTTDFVVQPDDPAIRIEMVEFPGVAGTIRGYLARPVGEGSFPGVVVIHENRGLIEPNMDIARRYAKEGFVALAPDGLSRVGGTEQFAGDSSQAAGAIGQLGLDPLAEDGNAAADYLMEQQFVSGGIGATGFCFGGGVVWRMGLRNTNLRAIAPHYGPPPPVDEVPNLRAAALGIYAEMDRITTQSEELWARLEAEGKTWETWVAPGASHAFFNNTGGSYAPEAAREAWARTLNWFDRFLAVG